MYSVHMDFHAHQLIKFIKKLKKFTHVLMILLYLCIKFKFKLLVTKEQ
jgi:hypothetical protein